MPWRSVGVSCWPSSALRLRKNPDKQARLVTFAVIGGGPTGVEMAGAICDRGRLALSRDFRTIDPRAARIILLEAGPRLLAAFPERLSAYARQSLVRMGV